ncbi:helix-turn-helix domain-containing protein [Curtobacterium sp. MCBA15_004]|uniref:helix-turn-helix domain-containing protein n=1 Tax=Curtobacterium sp. MCBA15_004 TaxID=1898733 RepID=UPI001114DB54|nr:helix-turn-helix transcriptional regulator [Curtobacterium sp. MCBA15_004]WIA98041.1 helix-turn-helix transcriptional regulator [Curtobacterium sp. MCBA15_004]
MQHTTPTLEERFGREVADRRRSVNMSQKALADLLTTAGLPLDASAISRIEKGTRALRLSEALLVARKMGFSLDLLGDETPPEEEYIQRRKRLDDLLMAAGEAVRLVADEANGIDWFIESNPAAFDTTAPELMSTIEAELRANWVLRSIATRCRTVEARDAIRSLVETVAAISVDDAVGEDSGE